MRRLAIAVTFGIHAAWGGAAFLSYGTEYMPRFLESVIAAYGLFGFGNVWVGAGLVSAVLISALTWIGIREGKDEVVCDSA